MKSSRDEVVALFRAVWQRFQGVPNLGFFRFLLIQVRKSAVCLHRMAAIPPRSHGRTKTKGRALKIIETIVRRQTAP